jgi:DnaA family protein
MSDKKTVSTHQLQQFPLALKLDRELSFESFWPNENPQPVAALQQLLIQQEPGWVYLAGGVGSGVSHLLQATSNAVLAGEKSGMAKRALYISLAEIVESLNAAAENRGEQMAALFDSLENFDLLCIDDVDSIAGQRVYQEQLFYLLIRLQQRGIRLVLGAKNTPAALDIELADLRSRLAFASVYQLVAPADSVKQKIMQHRAARLGLVMSDEVARFMLNHCARDLASLIAMLDRLDTQALAHSRKLSVPFVKQVFSL